MPSIEAAIRIRSLFELDPDFTVNVYSLTGSALTANDKVFAEVNEWRASKGLPPHAAEIQAMPAGLAVAMPIMVMPMPACPEDAAPKSKSA